jgi:hypothetical protein
MGITGRGFSLGIGRAAENSTDTRLPPVFPGNLGSEPFGRMGPDPVPGRSRHPPVKLDSARRPLGRREALPSTVFLLPRVSSPVERIETGVRNYRVVLA